MAISTFATTQQFQSDMARIRSGDLSQAPLQVRQLLLHGGRQTNIPFDNTRQTHQTFQNVIYTERLPEHLENDRTFLPQGAPPSHSGFGIDLNGNGRFDPKQDGVLAFDFNRDGKLDNSEISHSREILKSFSQPNYFPGGETQEERWNSEGIMRLRGQIDVNNDGKLSAEELKNSGAMIWIDSNGDGKVANESVSNGSRFELSETFKTDQFPRGLSPWGQLDFVDVRNNRAQTSLGSPFSGPKFPGPQFPRFPQPQFPQQQYPQFPQHQMNPVYNIMNTLMQMMQMMGGYGRGF
jgi:EF hand